LTNASSKDLELLLQDGRLRLASHQSIEAHWKPDETQPAALLRFRPLEELSWSWSGLVLCSDSSAGTFAYGIASKDSGELDVWTVEIAPEGGALAISFSQGSHFVARNKTTSIVLLHPRGCSHGIVTF